MVAEAMLEDITAAVFTEGFPAVVLMEAEVTEAVTIPMNSHSQTLSSTGDS